MKKNFLRGDSVFSVNGYTICTLKDFTEMQKDPNTKEIAKKLQFLTELSKSEEINETKKRLPVLVMGAKALKGDGRRTNENVVPSRRYVFDLDHLEDEKNIHNYTPEEVYGTFIEGKERDNDIFWVFVSPSGRGLKWAYNLKPGETIEQSQMRMAELLPEELRQEPFFDLHKDPSRCTYIVPEENNLYLDTATMFNEEDFEEEEAEFDEEKVIRYEDVANEDVEIVPEESTEQIFPDTYIYKGTSIPYKMILDLYIEKNEGEVHQGNRNKTVFEAVILLAPICDNKLAWIRQIVPYYTLSKKEYLEVTSHAMKYVYLGMTKKLRPLLEELKQKIDELKTEQDEAEVTPLWKTLYRELEGEGWPIGIKESLVEATNEERLKMPTLCATLTAMTAFLDKMKFVSVNGRNERPVLQTVIIGPKGSGKSVPSGAALEWWEILHEEETEAWEHIEQWQNSEDLPRPKDVIRAIPADFTKASIRDASINAQGATMLIVDDEMDTLISSNDYKDMLGILRKAFDGQFDGAKRAGRAGVSGITKSYISFVLNGTPDQGKELLGGKNLTNGNTDRILPCLLEKNKTRKIPRYPQRTEEDLDNIRQASEILRQAKGVIQIPRINEEADRWFEERANEAWDNEDEAMEEVLNRNIVIATRATIPYLILTGGEETDNVVKFMHMMLEYSLQMRYSIQKGWFENQERARMPKTMKTEPRPKKMSQEEIFNRLPQTFTYADIAAFFTGSTNSRDKMISRWKTDEKIKKVSSGKWTKI